MNHLDSDYFSTCSATGDQFAGRHILADFWEVSEVTRENLEAALPLTLSCDGVS